MTTRIFKIHIPGSDSLSRYRRTHFFQAPTRYNSGHPQPLQCMSFRRSKFVEHDVFELSQVSKALFLSLSCLGKSCCFFLNTILMSTSHASKSPENDNSNPGSLILSCSENFLASDAAELPPSDSASGASSERALDTESFRRGPGPRQYPMQPGPPCVEDGVTLCPRRELYSTYRQSIKEGKAVDSTSAAPGPTAKATPSPDPSMTNQAPTAQSDDPTPQPNVRRRGRIRELEEIKAQLAEKELELLSKENALLEQEQDIRTLQAELEIEKKLRALITKEKEEAEEEAALTMGLCSGSTMLP